GDDAVSGVDDPAARVAGGGGAVAAAGRAPPDRRRGRRADRPDRLRPAGRRFLRLPQPAGPVGNGPRPAALPPGPRGVHRTDDPRRAAGEGLGRPGPAADRVRPGRRGGDQDAGSPGPGVDRPGGQELPDRPGVPGRTPPCGREPVRPVLRPPAARQGPAAGRPAPRTRLVVRLTDCGDPMSTPTHNPPPADLATPPRPGLGRAVWSRAGAYLALTRPKQWTKNLFVLSPLVFSGRWADGVSVGLGVLAALAFVLVSGAVYCLNDSLDAAADRNH